MPNGHIYLALLRISSDSKCCAKAVSVEYRHNPFILFHVSWISLFTYILLCSWLHLCLVFPLFSELLVKLAGERSLRPAPKRFPPLGPLANGIEKNANDSTIHNNNNAERTKYDQTTIMTSFTRKSNSTEEDVTGFSSPYLCSRVVLNSGHPVQKSKCGACALTGYCSFKNKVGYSWLLVVTRGQSPPDLIVSTVKYILQRPLWVYGQRICCTDLAMLCSFAVRSKLKHFS